LKPIRKSGWSPLKEASKKVSLRKNEYKKAPHATPSRCHMGASSPGFFCHLSTSHWGVFEAWAASCLCHMTLSQWRGSSPLLAYHLLSSYWRVFKKLAR